MSVARPMLACLSLVACSTPMTVESNVRMKGEPPTIARALTAPEQVEVVDAMRSAEPAGFEAQPLERVPAPGRWGDARRSATLAAKSHEVAVVREEPLRDPGGRLIGFVFMLRSIRDETGWIRVRGSEAEGVLGVEASMGLFGQDGDLARNLCESFRREQIEAGSIPRPR